MERYEVVLAELKTKREISLQEERKMNRQCVKIVV